jgi:putative hemolysin
MVLLPITFLSIVLGELLPKRIGLQFPESIAALVARPMSVLTTIVSPFVWLLTGTNNFLLRMLGIRSEKSGWVTEEEIKSIISDSTESGEIQEIEQDIVERVFSMGDRKVGALMTHRSDLVWLDVHDDLFKVRNTIREAEHSAYPVADDELDNMLGIVLVRDLFVFTGDKPFSLKEHLKTPIYVPVTTPAYKVLEEFKRQKKHHALVLDEFGSIQGMVTMDDIIDALVGDSSDEAEEEYRITQINENQWIVDGPYPFFEFVRYFELEVPDDNLEFNTMGGFLGHKLQRLPIEGDQLSWQGMQFEVTLMDNRRVDKISISKKP